MPANAHDSLQRTGCPLSAKRESRDWIKKLDEPPSEGTKPDTSAETPPEKHSL
jgi:hypothetical protein